MSIFAIFWAALSFALAADDRPILFNGSFEDTENYQAYLKAFPNYISPTEYQAIEINRNLSFALKWTLKIKESSITGVALEEHCSSAFLELFLNPINQESLKALEPCNDFLLSSPKEIQSNFAAQAIALKNQALSQENLNGQKWNAKENFSFYQVAMINGVEFNLSKSPSIFLLPGIYQVILISDSHEPIFHYGTIDELIAKSKSTHAFVEGTCAGHFPVKVPFHLIGRSEVFYGSDCISKLGPKISKVVPPNAEIPQTSTANSHFTSSKWLVPVGLILGLVSLNFINEKEVSIKMP